MDEMRFKPRGKTAWKAYLISRTPGRSTFAGHEQADSTGLRSAVYSCYRRNPSYILLVRGAKSSLPHEPNDRPTFITKARTAGWVGFRAHKVNSVNVSMPRSVIFEFETGASGAVRWREPSLTSLQSVFPWGVCQLTRSHKVDQRSSVDIGQWLRFGRSCLCFSHFDYPSH